MKSPSSVDLPAIIYDTIRYVEEVMAAVRHLTYMNYLLEVTEGKSTDKTII